MLTDGTISPLDDPKPQVRRSRSGHRNTPVPTTVRRVLTQAPVDREEHLYNLLDEALLRGFTKQALALNYQLGTSAEAVEVRIKDVELFLISPERWKQKAQP